MSADHQSLLHGENAAYLQLLFDSYRKGTNQLAPAWQELFRTVGAAGINPDSGPGSGTSRWGRPHGGKPHV